MTLPLFFFILTYNVSTYSVPRYPRAPATHILFVIFIVPDFLAVCLECRERGEGGSCRILDFGGPALILGVAFWCNFLCGSGSSSCQIRCL